MQAKFVKNYILHKNFKKSQHKLKLYKPTQSPNCPYGGQKNFRGKNNSIISLQSNTTLMNGFEKDLEIFFQLINCHNLCQEGKSNKIFLDPNAIVPQSLIIIHCN